MGVMPVVTPEIPSPASDKPDPPPVRRLSQDLRAILREANGRAMTVAELESILQGRGFAMFILLLSAPFLVPAPGLSIPFGVALMLLGLRIAIGQKALLPAFLLRRRLTSKTLERVISPLAKIVERFEKHIRPRMHFLQERPWAINLIGVGIVSGGFLLSLPLPIPFSNGFPAVSIMLLAAGLMERDGLLVLWGYIMGVLSWIYIGFWWGAFVATLRWIWNLFF
ncbi:MAG: exopolysaccharide biosynthesis protein [Chthoniobacteraceae bacterium]